MTSRKNRDVISVFSWLTSRWRSHLRTRQSIYVKHQRHRKWRAAEVIYNDRLPVQHARTLRRQYNHGRSLHTFAYIWIHLPKSFKITYGPRRRMYTANAHASEEGRLMNIHDVNRAHIRSPPSTVNTEMRVTTNRRNTDVLKVNHRPLGAHQSLR